jgi:hypothetical protein
MTSKKLKPLQWSFDSLPSPESPSINILAFHQQFKSDEMPKSTHYVDKNVQQN